MTPQALFVVAAIIAIVAAIFAGIERAVVLCLLCVSVALIALAQANL